MTPQEFLARCRRKIGSAVDSMSSPPTIDLLIELSRNLEDILPGQLKEVIIEHPELFVRGASSVVHDNQIEAQNRRFEVVVYDSGLRKTLDVMLIELGYGVRRKRARLQHYPIANAGRYKRVRLCIPPDLRLDTEFLVETTQTVLSVGYAHLKQKLWAAIIREKDNLASELYESLRNLLVAPELLANLWLASMSHDKCFYLLEPNVALSSLNLIGPVADDIGADPIRILAEFMTRLTEVELSHAKGVVNLGRCVDVDLRASKYKSNAFLLTQAQMAIFESATVSLFPIVRTESTWLVAFFPTEHRTAIEPTLEAHKADLQDIFRDVSGRYRNVTALYRAARRHFDRAMLGELIGNALKVLIS